MAVTQGAATDAGDAAEGSRAAATRSKLGEERSFRHRAGDIVGGRYRVVGPIAAGGSGEVYDVERVELAQRCALKILRDDTDHDPTAKTRFLREARMMARLESEHVTRVIDFGYLDADRPFLVMERLAGEDLACLLRRVRRLPYTRAVRIIIDACWGANAVHAAGLVHRDIKPANLFVTRRDAGGDLCKLLDFGVSKSTNTTRTKPGRLVGTLRYMAPEQLAEGDVDHRTDLYALAVVLYECIAGHPPHRDDRIERILFSIMNRDPLPLAELFPEVPAGLSACVQRALARDPSARFQSTKDFARALLPYTRAVAVASKETAKLGRKPTPSKPKPPRRRWLGAFVAVCCGGLFMSGFSGRLPAMPRSVKGTPSQQVTPPSTGDVKRAWVAPSVTSPSTAQRTQQDIGVPVRKRREPLARPHTRASAASQPTESAFVSVGAGVASAQIDVRNPYGR